MRKVMLLAAILAVFVTMLVSTSWAEVKISPVISDPSGAPAVTPIHQGANRPDPESGAPDGLPALAPVVVAVNAAEKDPQLQRQLEEYCVLKHQAEQAEYEGDVIAAGNSQQCITHQVGVIQQTLTRYYPKPLTTRQVKALLDQPELWGKTQLWAQAIVAQAYGEGIAFGFHKGATAADEPGQKPATRQEAIAFATRAKHQAVTESTRVAQGIVNDHAGSTDAHGIGGLLEKVDANRLWLWLLSGVVAAILLPAFWPQKEKPRAVVEDDVDMPDWRSRRSVGGTTGT